MTFLFVLILTLSFSVGQLIKLPISYSSGINIVDLIMGIIAAISLLKFRINFKNLPYVYISFFAFIALGIISLVLSPLHLTSKELLVSFFYSVRLLVYLVVGFAIYKNYFPSINSIIKPTLILSGLCLAAIGLLQFIFLPNLSFLSIEGWDPHFYRLASSFLDPNFVGVFFILSMLLVIDTKFFKKLKIHYLLLSILFISLTLTFSRSSYLMFLVSFSIYALLTKSIKLFVITLSLFAILILSFSLYTQFVSKPRNIDRIQSASYRLDTWQQGFDIFKTSPLIGIGYNSYRYAIKENNNSGNFYLTHGASSNDSSLLFILATTGLIGLVIYIFFIKSIFILGFRNKSNIYLTAAIGGLLIESFFVNSLFYPEILLWVILTTSLSLSRTE